METLITTDYQPTILTPIMPEETITFIMFRDDNSRIVAGFELYRKYYIYSGKPDLRILTLPQSQEEIQLHIIEGKFIGIAPNNRIALENVTLNNSIKLSKLSMPLFNTDIVLELD